MARGATNLFSRIEPFRALPASLCRRMAESAVPLDLASGAPLWNVGDPVQGLVVVRRGALKVWRPVGAQHDVVIGLHGRGDAIGEAPLLGDDWASARRTDVAQAFGAAAVYVVPAEAVAAAASVSAPFALALGRLAAHRAHRLERRLGVLQHRTAHARVAALVQALADDFGVRDSRGVIVDLRLTHRDIASLVGVTRETVSVTLADLRKRGVLAVEGKRVVVLDADALQRTATGGNE